MRKECLLQVHQLAVLLVPSYQVRVMSGREWLFPNTEEPHQLEQMHRKEERPSVHLQAIHRFHHLDHDSTLKKRNNTKHVRC